MYEYKILTIYKLFDTFFGGLACDLDILYCFVWSPVY